MGVLDFLTGGKSSDADTALQNALSDIQGVQVPTSEEMQYKIQSLVQAGVLTPAQAQTYLQSPNAMLSENIPQTGTEAQEQAISQLEGAAGEGGLTPDEQAQMQQILGQLNATEKGANDAVIQNQAARGALTGGETMAAELNNNQTAAQNANLEGGQTAADAYNQMLQELSTAGTLGSSLQGQENTQADTVASATNAINQFNAAQQEGEANINTAAENTAQEENLANLQNIENTNTTNENAYNAYQAQLPEEVFNNQLSKGEAEAGISETQANLDTTQGGQNASLIGGLVGAAGDVAAAGMTPAPVTNIIGASDGGEIHKYLNGGVVDAEDPREKARILGNSPKNDKVPALLSEGEIVLPRTIAHNPEPDRVMSFLNRIRKPKQPHPDDVATVLHSLGRMREAI